jgi:hypothetical protein
MGEETARLATVLATIENSDNQWQSAAERKSVPAGWGSAAEWDGSQRRGSITSGQVFVAPDVEGWANLMEERGLDPEVYEIVGDSIKWCSWDGWKRAEGEEQATSCLCYSFRADIRLKRGMSDGLNPDWESILIETREAIAKESAPFKKIGKAVSLIVNLADFQIGNPDGGGVESQLEALLQIAPGTEAKVRSIEARGDHVDELIVAGLGDLMENCTGFYPNMEFFVELDHRDQMKLVRRFLRDYLQDIAHLAPSIVVTTVPGNHGEKRGQGKGSAAYTSVGDNTDVEVFEMVAEILAENSIYDHITFRIPTHEIATTYATKGHVISWTHGHKSFGGGGAAAQKLWNWWKGHAMGRAYEGVADSTILITGHYHHLNVLEQEGRTLFICPSLTDVGQYFSDATGYRTNPGVLMVEVVEGVSGIENFTVLRYK